MVTEPSDHHRLPPGLVAAVAFACVVPVATWMVVGVHVIPEGTDGYLVHSLLEWSSVWASLFTGLLGGLYLRVRFDYLVLTIALAALVSGIWDALHAIASIGLMPIGTEIQQFIPFTWAVSRMLVALVLTTGVGCILFRPPTAAPVAARWLGAGTIAVVGLVLLFLQMTMLESLPVAQHTVGLVKRPWDIPPLLLFAIGGVVLFPILDREKPSILSQTVWLSAPPAILASGLMAFLSTTIYDHPFQVAHALKLVSGLVPFIGLSLFFLRAFRRERLVADRLERTVTELKKSETRNRALVEALPDLMLLLDRGGNIIDYHAHRGAPLYRSPEEFLGNDVITIFPTHGERIQAAIRRTLEDGRSPFIECRMAFDGYTGDFETRFVRCGDDEVLAVVRDITEHKRLEKEVLDVSNREQYRIGHDLHDGISQQLTGIALLCKALQHRLSARDASEAAQAQQIEELVEEAIAETRSLARGLAPVELEGGGLPAALEELALGVERLFSVRCRLRWDEEIPIQNHAFATHLYRITQEAVNNALKHAEPSSIAITAIRDNGQIRLTVEDDGVGMGNDGTANGMGLHIMRYRARMIDASLDIHPAPDRGTVVSCEWSSPS